MYGSNFYLLKDLIVLLMFCNCLILFSFNFLNSLFNFLCGGRDLLLGLFVCDVVEVGLEELVMGIGCFVIVFELM